MCMKRQIMSWGLVIPMLFLFCSCLKKHLYKEEEEIPQEEDVYIYPFGKESGNVVAELTIQTDGNVDLADVEIGFPCLKYNKSWLFLLSQDDCKHAAFSCTWAAIHGKPLSKQYYYDIDHLKAGDLPPDAYYLGKTLGSTDGAGNEVRFAFTTTLSAEWDWMNEASKVEKGNDGDSFRFFMKSGLIWSNVIEMLNYGTGIAFHNVKTQDERNVDSIRTHFSKAQGITIDRLSGRGCKVLAEPDGNKAYVNAAQDYDLIQIMTAQNGGVVPLYPFKVSSDLNKVLLKRVFESTQDVKTLIEEQLKLRKEDRCAIQVGVHGTDATWAEFFLWLNNTYGKDGDDSVWFTSIEEYYEYNYYRIYGSVEKKIDGRSLKITIKLPSGQYFYYPSVTLNVKGLNKQHIVSVSSGNSVKGLSYGTYDEGMMFNVDCRKYLVEHATHFVEQYEGNKTEANRNDALYFVNMLKESDKKSELLKRIK